MTSNDLSSASSGTRKRSPVVRWGLPLAAASSLIAGGFGAGRVTSPVPAPVAQEPSQQVIFLDCPNPDASEQAFPSGPAERVRIERVETEDGVSPRITVTWRGAPPEEMSVATGFALEANETHVLTVEPVSDANTQNGVTTVTGPAETGTNYEFVYGGVGEGLGDDFQVVRPFTWIEGAAGAYSPVVDNKSRTSCSIEF